MLILELFLQCLYQIEILYHKKNNMKTPKSFVLSYEVRTATSHVLVQEQTIDWNLCFICSTYKTICQKRYLSCFPLLTKCNNSDTKQTIECFNYAIIMHESHCQVTINLTFFLSFFFFFACTKLVIIVTSLSD